MNRMMAALLVSTIIVLVTGPRIIEQLHKLNFGQTIYQLGPEKHKSKQGTPVMGGLLMALSMLVCGLILHPAAWQGGWDFMLALLAVSFLSMLVGFADDYIKAVKKRHEGLTPWQKIVGQAVVAVGFSTYCYFQPMVGSSIWVPFLNIEWDLGVFYIPIMSLLVVFIVNSTNLQDGLDGLLSTVTIVGTAAWGLFALFLLNSSSAPLNSMENSNLYSVGIFAMTVCGSCIGFLRFNRFPAKIFMGDTGSMLLGGAVVGMAMLTRQPLLLLFFCAGPIVSSLSVILQRTYFKLTHGKRILKMSPLHHHFELSGYSETQIVSMYAGVTAILSLLALLSLHGMGII